MFSHQGDLPLDITVRKLLVRRDLCLGGQLAQLLDLFLRLHGVQTYYLQW